MTRGALGRLRALHLPRVAAVLALLASTASLTPPSTVADQDNTEGQPTSTPIKHVVVLFQENISFDHYFATYPNATNAGGEPRFVARHDTPSVNGLSPDLLTNNPNLSNPTRLDRREALTCDQDHDYTPEQNAVDHGAMDLFVQNTDDEISGKPATRAECDMPPLSTPTANDYAVMDYYDGNTVTAMWNYAQHFALSDNSYGTVYGPSTPGALNVTSGSTYPALCSNATGTSAPGGDDPAVYAPSGSNVGPCPGVISTKASAGSTPGNGTGTVVSDADPYYDACSGSSTIAMGGSNIGDLLNSKGLTWGWFEGGFSSPNYVPGDASSYDASTICTGRHYNIGAGSLDGKACATHSPAQPLDTYCELDYSPHHQPFQYYASTGNPRHLPPTSVAMIGHADRANHQYDTADFFAALDSGHLPAVSYLKAPRFEDGHAANSDPLDEQHWVVDTINRLERSPYWRDTAVIINWDDSDGWYDHVLAPLETQSQTPLDTLSGTNQCGTTPREVPDGQQGRCGLGPRLPLLVVSAYARENFVDHSVTDQTSIIQFIEDNWSLGRIGGGSADAEAGTLRNMFNFDAGPRDDRLFLDPVSGQLQ
ncbi:MAG: alkaline phosphatase family protein [Chloroflexi bacterium]|nr:alkaline phosphatase family protein [Chloroflexota bacterium]